MRRLLNPIPLFALSLALAGCPEQAGPPGPQGPAGPPGIQGPPGEAASEDGLRGPAGPAGASVVATPVPVGDENCLTGGLRVEPTEDGGVSFLCNGAVGSAGPQGPAGAAGPQGPIGAQGPVGAQGAAGPQGATGAQGPTGLQGSQGPQGPQGPTGAAGPQGPQGPQGLTGAAGPAGAPGEVLYLDGGVVLLDGQVTFAGFTTAAYTGNLGGRLGAHAICAGEFPGAYFCESDEYVGLTSTATVPVSGAWVDDHDPAAPGRRGTYGTCAHWANGSATGGSGTLVGTDGFLTSSYLSSYAQGCDVPRPLTCCRKRSARPFRGFTPQTFNGNLSGRIGAHAKCAAAYPGSHLCHQDEYVRSLSAAPVPASGAWVDDFDADASGKRGTYNTCARWANSSATGGSGGLIGPDGFLSSSYVSAYAQGCDVARPLACCD